MGEKVARPERLELPTKWFEATYSIQLSYGRVRRGLYRSPQDWSSSLIHC
jgi:hypothetical protein